MRVYGFCVLLSHLSGPLTKKTARRFRPCKKQGFGVGYFFYCPFTVVEHDRDPGSTANQRLHSTAIALKLSARLASELRLANRAS